MVSAGARAGGYTRTQQPLADVDAVVAGVEPPAKAHISKFCGDVLGEMRKRKKADEDKIGEGKAAPAAPAKSYREDRQVLRARSAKEGQQSQPALVFGPKRDHYDQGAHEKEHSGRLAEVLGAQPQLAVCVQAKAGMRSETKQGLFIGCILGVRAVACPMGNLWFAQAGSM